jgi:histidyl-tRNA synthetase
MLTGGFGMSAINAPRGVRDILPEESWKWAFVLQKTMEIAEKYAYNEIHLPLFEHTELFSRGIGETTDVVEKEMYTFEDRGGRSLTLRPEATASMVRAYLQNKMQNGVQPEKLWCAGPMFRYERPQKGRYRQFWQLDFEALGTSNPMVDVEVISIALGLFRNLGLSNLDVVINSVGCPVCRPDYREKLKSYFEARVDDLCDTCRNRLDRNPLRILDCKNPKCREVTEDAPDIYESLCPECKEHFDMVMKGLSALNIHYQLDKRLVRGLDYYTKTAFEILSGELGAQNAVCGGGRYDNLSESIGGPSLPGVGFAAGLERIVLIMEQQGCSFGNAPGIDVYVIAADKNIQVEAMSLVWQLREQDIRADMDFMARGMKAQFKSAVNKGASHVCILGGDELERGVVTVKDLSKGEQTEISRDQLISFIKQNI